MCVMHVGMAQVYWDEDAVMLHVAMMCSSLPCVRVLHVDASPSCVASHRSMQAQCLTSRSTSSSS